MTEKKVITIDATEKRLGRIASEAARYLMGKDTPAYTPNRTTPISVVIENAGKLYISDRKQNQKEYVRYSGYPGGKKTEKMGHLLARRGISEVLRKAVYGMLPSNKLRSIRMKALTIKE